jgi:2-polyprenyl-3-methyl-5-hydroxy-6-metoxy-1,4-benzoquinol methylase
MALQCALCESNELTQVAHKDSKSGLSLQVFCCDKCGLVQQAPLPEEDELRQYYSDYYRIDYKGTRRPKAKHVFRAARCAKQRLDFLIRSGITSGSLLDIGAGSGELVALAAQTGFDASGLEPNRHYAEYARSEFGIRVSTGHLEDATGRFDVVSLFHVLEHLRSLFYVFKQLHALVKPDGKLFIEVPWALSGSISPSNRYFKAHLFYFDVETLAAAASGYFEVLNTETSDNLRMLLAPKSRPEPISLPTHDYPISVRHQLDRHGWIHYTTHGQGWRKPAKIIQRLCREFQIRSLRGKEIIKFFDVNPSP